MKILIRHGRVVDPASRFDQIADLGIEGGKVAFIGEPPAGFSPDETIDATGLIVCPGLVDLSVRLREPGGESKSAMQAELSAAAAGGVTALAIPPDTDPPLDEPGLVRMLKHRSQLLKGPKVCPVGALTVKLAGETIPEMGELAEAGCVAFSHGDIPLANTLVLFRAMQYASTFDLPVWLRPQDPFLAHSGFAHDGEFATLRGLPSIPVAAELIALYAHLELAKETQSRLHVQQISSAAALELIRWAKAEGLPVTCDVAVHHLHLCDEDIGYYDSNCFVFPPLRSEADRAALRVGLADGTIDALCSDHAPVEVDAKLTPFADAQPGVTAVELLLPLTLKWAKEVGLEMIDTLSIITSRPAAILGIGGGCIAVGGAADLCLFAPDQIWVPTPESLRSLGKNTPYLGQEVVGKVHYTFVGGVAVYRP